MSLVPIDPKSETSVLTLLERAAVWLSEAVHRGDPGEVAMVKAQLATAAEATKQLNLSKDIQLDAQEMVRRAEYALGKAIRRGQSDGTISDKGYAAHVRDHGLDETVVPAKAMVPNGQELHQIRAMADGADPADFDAALSEAKAEGNLSRANVVRKVKKQAGPVTRDERADLIADLAAQGWSSRQMPKRVGISEEAIRKIARDFDIEIPADKVVRGTRRLNHTQMVENVVTGLDDLVTALSLVDFTEVDPTEADEWVASLTDSIAALNRFKKQIKETTHV